MGELKRCISWICGCAACVLLFASCSAPAPTTLPALENTPAYESAWQDMRAQYRNASLIVRGECVLTHTDANGRACAHVAVEDVLAGSAVVGEILQCEQNGMQPGETYLLYMSDAEDVDYAEDTAGYVVNTEPMPIVDENVMQNGHKIPYDSIVQEIKALGEVLNVSAPLYYYDRLAQLVEASDEIFIGRVTQAPAFATYTFFSRDGGANQKSRREAAIVQISAYGSIKGAINYGDAVEMIHCPSRMSDLLDSATLTAVGLNEKQMPLLVRNGVYLFFLTRSPDAKQSYYQEINPLQGAIRLDGDLLETLKENGAVYGYKTLTALVKEIQRDMHQTQRENEQAPVLTVNE